MALRAAERVFRVANNFPAPYAQGVSGIKYTLSLEGGIEGAWSNGQRSSIRLPSIELTISFPVGPSGSYDYSQFDQDTCESQLLGLVANIVDMAVTYGNVPLATAQAANTVTREFLFGPQVETLPVTVGSASPPDVNTPVASTS